jgi:uncharacterized tellurite resistance protein B-like protein
MMDLFKRLFGDDAATQRSQQDSEREVVLAVCALLVEMGRIDETFSPAELDHVLSILGEKYGLSDDRAKALIREADRELEASVDLWQFARVINDTYSIDEKIRLIERLWQIVYVDGKMDQHEHYLMNKLSNLLRLSHKQLIDAKLRVLHGDAPA